MTSNTNTYMGKLGEIIKSIITIIKNDYKDTYNGIMIDTMICSIYKQISEMYSEETPYMLIRDIVYRLLDTKITFKDTIDDINFRNWDKLYNIDEINPLNPIVIPKEMKELEKHFMNLFNTPQPEQKTKEWFDYRFNRITASDMATALDFNPYESVESFICKKCDPNFPFLDNDFVFHGKKYEQIATSLYEHLYNSKVTEFGCLPSEKYKILGASPDGIGSKSTLDYKLNPKLGYMLEIKCPYVREIKKEGKIAGEICPFYYYCQVQQQLECCDLNYCDFIQCKLLEYKDRNEYLEDSMHKMDITENDDATEMVVDNIMSRGYLLQFLPKQFTPLFDGDKHHYKSFYIYPPRLTMTREQYDEWVLTNLNDWKINYPDKADSYYFDKVIYWKIEEAHTVTIPRDTNWFNSILPILEDTWEKVVYYREHLDELPPLQQISDKRKKFYKMNTTFALNNFEKGSRFLDKTPKITKKYIKKTPCEDSGFID
jgi:putative phage-type endonuclease